jgi:hypothetical protein
VTAAAALRILAAGVNFGFAFVAAVEFRLTAIVWLLCGVAALAAAYGHRERELYR